MIKWILNKITPKSLEVRAVLGALDQAEFELNKICMGGLDEAISKVRYFVNNDGNTVRLAVDSGQPPNYFVYKMIGIDLQNHLASGHLHVYRGVLGMQGNEILKAFHYCIAEMKKAQFQDENELNMAESALIQAIREVG